MLIKGEWLKVDIINGIIYRADGTQHKVELNVDNKVEELSHKELERVATKDEPKQLSTFEEFNL